MSCLAHYCEGPCALDRRLCSGRRWRLVWVPVPFVCVEFWAGTILPPFLLSSIHQLRSPCSCIHQPSCLSQGTPTQLAHLAKVALSFRWQWQQCGSPAQPSPNSSAHPTAKAHQTAQTIMQTTAAPTNSHRQRSYPPPPWAWDSCNANL